MFDVDVINIVIYRHEFTAVPEVRLGTIFVNFSTVLIRNGTRFAYARQDKG